MALATQTPIVYACFVALFSTVAIALVSTGAVDSSGGGVGVGGFDVLIDLVSGWPAVSQRGLSFEWAKRLGPVAAREALKRLAAGEATLWAPEAGADLVAAFAAVVSANRLLAPVVEAQRASCRELARQAIEATVGIGAGPCGGRAFAFIDGSTTAACDPSEAEHLLERIAAENSARVTTGVAPWLLVDAMIFGIDFLANLGNRNASRNGGQVAVICGCVDDEAARPFLSWALRLHASRFPGNNLTVLFRQADCPETGTALPDRLAGYGIELRIKSSEYKATVDDNAGSAGTKKVADASVAEPEDEGEVEPDAEEDSAKAALRALQGVRVLDLHLDRLAARLPSLGQMLLTFREQIEGESVEADLKRWELADIGLQAAARVRQSPEPLATLESLTGNFPGTMAVLARDRVRRGHRKALSRLRTAGTTEAEGPRVELNGQPLPLQFLPLFEALRLAETQFVGLAQLGSGADTLTARINAVAKMAHTSTAVSTPLRLDWRDPGLTFVYNVRNDATAEEWPSRLSALASEKFAHLDAQADSTHALMRSMEDFGHGVQDRFKALAEVRQPLFTVVFVFDPSDASALRLAVNLTMSARPARVALVPVSKAEQAEMYASASASAAAVRTFGWLLKEGKKTEGRRTAVGFLSALLERIDVRGASGESMALEDVGAALRGAKGKPAAKGKSKGKPNTTAVEAELLRKATDGGAEFAGVFQRYVLSKGLPVPCLVVNGIVVLPGVRGTDLPRSLQAALTEEGRALRSAVLQKRLQAGKKSADVDRALEDFALADSGRSTALFDKLLTPGLVFERVSAPVAPALAQGTLSMPTSEESVPGDAKRASVEATSRQPHVIAVNLPGDTTAQLPSFRTAKATATHGVDEVLSLDLVLFISRVEALPLVPAFARRLAVSQQAGRLSVALAPRLGIADPALAARLHACLLAATTLEELAELPWPPDDTDPCSSGRGATLPAAVGASEALWSILLAMSTVPASLAQHGALAVCNGRLVPNLPLASSESVAALVEAHWCPVPPDRSVPAHLAAAAVVAMPPPRSQLFERCEDSARTPPALRVRLRRRNPAMPALLEVAALIDPLWEGATAFAAAARLLHGALNAEVCIVLNPRTVVEEYPLKRWARHVVAWPPPTSAFTPEGSMPPTPLASFERLRTRHTLTAWVVSPPSWLVSARASVHDLDNIRQIDAIRTRVGTVYALRPQVTATYELLRLYIEGSAFTASGEPAAGLQLELIGPDGSIEDTRVMKSQGFWSMPALPGRYILGLKDGASSETFMLVDHPIVAGAGTFAVDTTGMALEITSFDVPFASISVQTRPGAKPDDLVRRTFGTQKRRSWRRKRRPQKVLEDHYPGGSLESSSNVTAKVGLPSVHIFSVASGHLYERLLAIMMLSVRRHTACPLHFWLVDNFLSPEFKELLLPQLVAQHGGGNMTFDLVSFKWPSWLNPQTEKQRLIWAYKILFLDVLFPMDVPRVLFIDADQVVRADVLELWNMDLQSNVYGFTPFCSGVASCGPMGFGTCKRENTATRGYRFWESGFWKSHLGNHVYHISALFVVDLDEFRRLSVGDQLRSMYNSLTLDPNGLANLDQDLPNYAQHVIPMFSLPQEWLWCESWCSDDVKPLAKTIDLCQNPMTKEPKITMARRIIPEWDGYHSEVLALGGDVGPSSSALHSRSAAAVARGEEL